MQTRLPAVRWISKFADPPSPKVGAASISLRDQILYPCVILCFYACVQDMTDQLKITQPIIVRVIDVPNITFNSWRTRNNLFPHTKLNAKRKTFSWDELCVAIVVARMIKMGMAAQRAVDIGMALLPAFKSGAKPIAVIRSAEDIEYRNNAEVEVLAEPAIVFDMTDLRAWAVLRLVELYPEIMSHPEFYGVQPANRTKTKRRPSRKVQT